MYSVILLKPADAASLHGSGKPVVRLVLVGVSVQDRRLWINTCVPDQVIVLLEFSTLNASQYVCAQFAV